jgi:hypothetical protein
VRLGRVARSWYWGADPGPARQEPYKGAPDGGRLVQYFDKARMEITNPGTDRASPWFVTNGLLVREMIDGRLQVGDDATEQRLPAAVPLAGDGDPRAPTYASLTGIAWSNGDRRVPNRTGRPVIESINRVGKIVEQRELADHNVVNAHYAPETGHNIPDVFWQFLQQRGLVATPNGLEEGLIAEWLVAFGLPLTEAYWTRATVGGVEQAVLVQAFERRILTYTPANPAAWRVEMGNVGQHYYRWRYPA